MLRPTPAKLSGRTRSLSFHNGRCAVYLTLGNQGRFRFGKLNGRWGGDLHMLSYEASVSVGGRVDFQKIPE
ncbi:MAG: hypothetical protein WCQ21_32865 [Verrucomicrobiota bacterium]